MMHTIGKVILGNDIMEDLKFVWQNTDVRMRHVLETRIMTAVGMYLLAINFLIFR